MKERSSPDSVKPARSILLVGFMCSGKSTVGKVLAPLLDLPFVDLDRVIEQRVGPITPFFQREGEAAFRAVEQEVLGELLNGPQCVLATGGGTPCEADNLARMKASGTVVWLDVPLADLMPRVERAGRDRPLLFGLSGDELRGRVEELLAERGSVYAQAQMIVQAGGAPDVVAERIVRTLALQAM